MLLEKAYSKLIGTYEKTKGGLAFEGLMVMSGAPTELLV